MGNFKITLQMSAWLPTGSCWFVVVVVDPSCSSLPCVCDPTCRYELYSCVRWSRSVCTVLSLPLEDGRQPIPHRAPDPEPFGHLYLGFHLLPAVQEENLLEDLEDEGRQECQRTLFISSVLEAKLKTFWRLQPGDAYHNSCDSPEVTLFTLPFMKEFQI